MSRIIAIAGAKGGVGKTTTSLNLGAALASNGYSVGVVELDLAMGNFVDFLTIDGNPEEGATLHDVLAEEEPIREASYRAPGGFAVFPSGTDLDGYAEASLDPLSGVLSIVKHHFDVVLLDTGAGLSNETIRPLQLADEVVLVATPRVASIRDTDKTQTLVERVDGSVAGLVLNMSGTGNSPRRIESRSSSGPTCSATSRRTRPFRPRRTTVARS
ncbi:P-loop NTPase [Haloarculaceae archaeon H-GB2-1]|nr:P-loop NTPase [Haloarculaceae archaeon H-GB11]MEA5406588.1 P-loop NTPase [Haloarculaceae archaeon H-GB2-1]